MSKPKLIKGLAAVAVLLSTAACYSKPHAATQASAIAGPYSGSITHYRFPGPTASAPMPLFGAVAGDGTGYFIATHAASSDIRVFRKLAETGRITSPEYEVPTEGRPVPRGPRNWKIDIRPTAGGENVLHGKFNDVSGYLALDLRAHRFPGGKFSFDSIAGAYRGIDVNRGTTAAITLHAAGRFGGSDAAGCRLSGTLTHVGKGNLFDVQLTLSGSSPCHGAMTGVAFFAARDRTGQLSGTTGPYLYLIGANRDLDHGFAMALSRHRN